MIQYFLHDGNQERGPFDMEQLKTQNLKKDTKIWHEGLESWTTVDKLVELKDLLIRKTPPPLLKPTEEIKSITSKLEQAPPTYSNPNTYTEQVIVKKKSKLIPIIIISLLVIGGIAGWLIYQNVKNGETIDSLAEKVSTQDQTISSQEKVLTQQDNAEQEKQRVNAAITEKNMNYRNNWSNYIRVSTNNFTYSEMGGIKNLEVIVTNKTEYMLDEVEVLVLYIKANGESFKTETVTVYNIPANGSKNTSAPESIRGTYVESDIQGIISKKMHFCYSSVAWGNNSEDPYFCK